MNRFTIVLDTLSATSTANFTKTNTPIISAGDGTTPAKLAPLCSIYDIVPNSVIKMAANTSGTAGTGTIAPTGTTNGVTYAVRITQLDPVTQDYYENDYYITTPAAGSVTATTISAQFIAKINNDPNLHITASTSGTDVLLTAAVAYATFDVNVLVLGLGLTYTAGTLGVYKFGVTPYYDLARTGVDTTTIVGSASGYTLYSWVANVPDLTSNMEKAGKPTQFNVWVNLSDSNGAALVTAIDAIWTTNIGIVGAVGTR